MRITVVGGCGFIGSHLVDRLCKDGHRVHVVDDRAYGIGYNVQSRGATLFGKGLRKWTRDEGGDYVFDLIGQGAAADFNRNPRGCSGFNVDAVDAVTKFARQNHGGFLIASDVGRCGRNYQPYGFFIAGKRLGEECAKHSIGQGVRGHILRLYPVYGQRMSAGRLVSDMIASAKSGKDIIIYGDGANMAAPVHVLDVVDAMVACMNLSSSVPEPLVIGGDELVSVLGLARMVKRLAKSKSKIVFVPGESDELPEPLALVPEPIKVLGWTPKISLEDGLKELL